MRKVSTLLFSLVMLTAPVVAEDLKSCLTVMTSKGEQKLADKQKYDGLHRLYVATSSQETVVLVAQAAQQDQSKFAQLRPKVDGKGTYFDLKGLEGQPSKFYLAVLPEQSAAARDIVDFVKKNPEWNAPRRGALSRKLTNLQNTPGVAHFGVQVDAASVSRPGPSSSNPATAHKAKTIEQGKDSLRNQPGAGSASPIEPPPYKWLDKADINHYEPGKPVLVIYEIREPKGTQK